jgi:hypothetical protein
VTFNLPALEASTFDATELDQDDGGDPTPAPDPYERELPTGMIKPGRVKAEFKYTKANYTRLQALLARRGFTFIATSPDDLTSSGATLLYTTFMGFIAKLDEVKFEKTNPVMIPVEIVVQESPSYEDPTP